jgi:hypothetical protein
VPQRHYAEKLAAVFQVPEKFEAKSVHLCRWLILGVAREHRSLILRADRRMGGGDGQGAHENVRSFRRPRVFRLIERNPCKPRGRLLPPLIDCETTTYVSRRPRLCAVSLALAVISRDDGHGAILRRGTGHATSQKRRKSGRQKKTMHQESQIAAQVQSRRSAEG